VTTTVLLLYLPTFTAMAAVAADPRVDLAAVRNPSPVVHAGAAMVLLLLAAALSIYKPRGMTRYGWRRRQQERDGNRPATARTVTESRERPHGLPTHRIREPVARFGLAGGDGDRGWLTPERDRDRLLRPSAAPTPSPERRSTAPRPQFEAPASGRLVADRVASGLGRTRGRI
jgi:hypothetical protein